MDHFELILKVFKVLFDKYSLTVIRKEKYDTYLKLIAINDITYMKFLYDLRKDNINISVCPIADWDGSNNDTYLITNDLVFTISDSYKSFSSFSKPANMLFPMDKYPQIMSEVDEEKRVELYLQHALKIALKYGDRIFM